MRTVRRNPVMLALSLGLPALALLYFGQPGGQGRRRPPVPLLSAAGPRRRPPAPRSPSEAARREASRRWGQANLRATQVLERLEAWDPSAVATQRDRWRRSLMAADAGGDLERARRAAARAEIAARTADETYEAAVLLSRIECEAGDHEAELRQAHILVRLQPRDPLALTLLLHAAVCTHQVRLARQAAATLAALYHLPFTAPVK